jgi:hypothetical protein
VASVTAARAEVASKNLEEALKLFKTGTATLAVREMTMAIMAGRAFDASPTVSLATVVQDVINAGFEGAQESAQKLISAGRTMARVGLAAGASWVLMGSLFRHNGGRQMRLLGFAAYDRIDDTDLYESPQLASAKTFAPPHVVSTSEAMAKSPVPPPLAGRNKAFKPIAEAMGWSSVNHTKTRWFTTADAAPDGEEVPEVPLLVACTSSGSGDKRTFSMKAQAHGTYGATVLVTKPVDGMGVGVFAETAGCLEFNVSEATQVSLQQHSVVDTGTNP